MGREDLAWRQCESQQRWKKYNKSSWANNKQRGDGNGGRSAGKGMSQRGGRVASGSIGTAPRLCGTCRCRRQRQKVNGGQSSASEPAIECRALLSERRAIDRESASHANPPPNASPLQVATINQSIAPLFFRGYGHLRVNGAWWRFQFESGATGRAVHKLSRVASGKRRR